MRNQNHAFAYIRRLGLAIGAATLAACTGLPETKVAPAPGRAPLTSIHVLVDRDVIGAAFASYRGSVPFGSRTGDYQGFMENLVAGIQAEAAAASITAQVDVVSLKAARATPVASRGRPVLTVKATSYTTRKEVVGGRDLGWSGDTAWEFSLAERKEGSNYQTAWVGVVKHENLNPALCGNYDRCSKALAERIFSQMRKDGLIRAN